MLFRDLEPEDVLVSSFQVNKTFTFTDANSGSGVYGVHAVKSTPSTLYNYNLTTANSSSFGTGSADAPKTRTFYKIPLWHTINKLYYRDITDMKGTLDFIQGVRTGSSAYFHTTESNPLDVDFGMPVRKLFTRQLHNTANVISIPQKFYGESIQKKSVRITDNSTAATLVLEDDGFGNLYDVAHSSSYSTKTPSPSTNSGSVVGNVFYDDGLIVITDTGSYSRVGANSGSNGFTVKFNATETIYEREYTCRLGENEFLGTTNNSLKVGYSSSYATPGSAWTASLWSGTIHDTFQYDRFGYSSGSFVSSHGVNPIKIGTELIGVATHSDFATYVTSVGLYNDENELLAVGKLANPIKNDRELALAFVVRFDTN
jgi:hypothetical protein|tara:strand:+ start:17970 stop:19085 length:1116 start_codon:yes stop_codon:yes gene_type:complete